MKLKVRFTFEGNAEEALAFYAKVLGGKIVGLIRYKDMQEDYDMSGMSDEDLNRIMNTCLMLGDTSISVCDQFPGQTVTRGNSMMMDLALPDAKQTQNVFNALAEGGSVIIPLSPAAWTPLYGLVTDKFGNSWNIMQAD